MNFIKIKNFCSSKDIIKERKRQVRDRENYLEIMYLVKDLYPDYVKNFDNKKINNPIKMSKDWDFPGGPVIKDLLANAGTRTLIPGLRRSHVQRSNKARENNRNYRA